MTERIFLAGATGVIGSRLVPLLVSAGHSVGAMTRTPHKAKWLSSIGAEPIICDVFNRAGLADAVKSFSPDVVLHELTDLPDAFEDIPTAQLLNARIREEGTRNLIDAMNGLSHARIIAQSIAWTTDPGPGADAVSYLEQAVLGMNGVVLRYGAFYGPGTYYEGELPSAPRVHIDTAAARTVEALDAPSGILTVVD
ncbi:epimerase [Mycolicibacterium moriokaense]|jgi:nucleoside-diphosphate-sugar epimerase|uniref:dTDP-glucose 4,6-dehydratase n=1 Tax=Mycolicibacterium moriokaense TaxID=39691 RepID=A0AAD1M8R3_9MYCO|nr:NAD(P)H-binding protein [Mycolicibacterium moriokaense]MCV7039275.1 NAD(P)H-binding protein [Mycolicibacterium moriokaense]ORB26881.1 epimerase [Mycolicibacterium moriokaense]BBX03795.1 dTDP-glucose 4,6-dehydratase [Mycolicibacterium moriokaense]